MPATTSIEQGIQQSSSEYNSAFGISGESNAEGTPANITFEIKRPSFRMSIFSRFALGIVL